MNHQMEYFEENIRDLIQIGEHSDTIYINTLKQKTMKIRKIQLKMLHGI